MQNIGDVIKKYRLKNDLTQEALGKELFVTKQAVSKCENGKTLPDIITIRKLIMPILLASILLSFFFALGDATQFKEGFKAAPALLLYTKITLS